jgi:hypothetical protein
MPRLPPDPNLLSTPPHATPQHRAKGSYLHIPLPSIPPLPVPHPVISLGPTLSNSIPLFLLFPLHRAPSYHCVHSIRPYSFPSHLIVLHVSYACHSPVPQVSILDPILPELQGVRDGEYLLQLLYLIEVTGDGWERMSRTDKERLAEVRLLPSRKHQAGATAVRLLPVAQVGGHPGGTAGGAPCSPVGPARCCALRAPPHLGCLTAHLLAWPRALHPTSIPVSVHPTFFTTPCTFIYHHLPNQHAPSPPPH